MAELATGNIKGIGAFKVYLHPRVIAMLFLGVLGWSAHYSGIWHPVSLADGGRCCSKYNWNAFLGDHGLCIESTLGTFG